MTIERRFGRALLAAVSLILAIANSAAAAEIQPLQIVQAEHPETWIGTLPGQKDATWLIRHDRGLKKVEIPGGAETEIPTPIPHTRGQMLGRCISANGVTFAHFSADQERLTVARVADATTVAVADSKEILSLPSWPYETFLSADGSSCVCLLNSTRGCRLARIEFMPTVRVVATQVLGPLVHDICVEAGGLESVVVTPTDPGRRGARFLRCFDRYLGLQHKQALDAPCFVGAVLTLPDAELPLVVLAGLGQEGWRLLRREQSGYTTVCSGGHLSPQGVQVTAAAALSPDANWIVTSPVSNAATLTVWSATSGDLKREIRLPGPLDDGSGKTMIFRLTFSQSGEYLSASNCKTAWLLRFADLIADETSQ